MGAAAGRRHDRGRAVQPRLAGGEDDRDAGRSSGSPASSRCRDLWLHKDLGASNGEFQAVVPAHGALLVKIGRPKRR